MSSMLNQPIGFFDSGWGGLSILKAARALLPHEDFYYVADCGNAPYGDQTHDYIVNRAMTIARFLFEEKNVKALVIACNTATIESIASVRATWPDRIILGVEPAIKPAAAASKTGVIGAISTARTAASARMQAIIEQFAQGVKVLNTGCPGLMECVERGEFMASTTFDILHRYLDPMVAENIDGLVLGCTHYPFLNKAIREIVGDNVAFFEPGPAVSKHLQSQLAGIDALKNEGIGKDAFWVSDLTDARKQVAQTLYPSDASFAAFDQ